MTPEIWIALCEKIEKILYELDMAGEIYTGHYNYLCMLLDRYYDEERTQALYAEMEAA